MKKDNRPIKEQQSGCQIAVKFGTINLCWNQSHFPNHLQTGFLSLITSLWSPLYIELSHIIMVRSIFSKKLHISRKHSQVRIRTGRWCSGTDCILIFFCRKLWNEPHLILSKRMRQKEIIDSFYCLDRLEIQSVQL